MTAAADALVTYAQRHAEKAKELAEKEKNPKRKRELQRIAEICSRVPAHAPRDFWEALQYYWFVHLGVIIEYNTWDSFNPGRLDQHLHPFYEKGLRNGTLTRNGAKELLQAFWIKFNNQPAPPKVGVTAQESGTYTDFALVNFGGLKEDGSNAVNELSYLLLDIVEEMRILQPSSMVQISRKNPDSFLHRALKIIRTGFGQPSIFNTDAIVKELVRQGKSLEDAFNGGASGCVEAGAFGKENYNLTGYFNLPKVLEITLHNGLDPRTGKKIGLTTGDPTTFSSYEELFEAFRKQVKHFIDIKIRGNNVIERLYADKIMKSVFEVYFEAIDGRPNTRGGYYRINLLPTTCHIYFGKVLGATPDGRKAGEPVSEGVSPVQGADRRGPTAVLKSVAKMDHIRTGGTLLNQKFTPQILDDEDGLKRVGDLVRAYFEMDGHHVQFNVVTAETLRDAQKHPEKYRDLVVRVAGYSDYFVDITPSYRTKLFAERNIGNSNRW